MHPKWSSSMWLLQNLCATRGYTSRCTVSVSLIKATSACHYVCSWHLSFSDTVSFHFNAWLVNNCVCRRYDVLHSRRAFSVCLPCVHEHVCMVFWCSPRLILFFCPQRNICIHVQCTLAHTFAHKSQFVPLSRRIIWLEHAKIIRKRWTDLMCHSTCTPQVPCTHRERGGIKLQLHLIYHL